MLRPRDVVPYLLLVGVVGGGLAAWREQIRRHALAEAKAAAIEARADSLAAKHTADSLVIDSLEQQVQYQSEVADTAIARAQRSRRALSPVQGSVDSLLALGSQVAGLSTALAKERSIHEEEKANLREALVAQQHMVVALQAEVDLLKTQRDALRELNEEIRRDYRRALSQANPGFLGRLLRDPPEKIIVGTAGLVAGVLLGGN